MKFLLCLLILWGVLPAVGQVTENQVPGTWTYMGTPWCIDNPSGDPFGDGGWDLDTRVATQSGNIFGFSRSIFQANEGGSATINIETSKGFIEEPARWTVEDDGLALKVEGSSGKLYLTYIGELSGVGTIVAFEGAESIEEELEACGSDRSYIYPYMRVD